MPMMEEGAPFTWFSGKLQGGTIQDKRDAPAGETRIVWTCTNDFYNFERVQGRFTNDESHRALVIDPQGNKVPSGAQKRPEYNEDLGFFHQDKTVNIIAKYQTKEQRYKIKQSRKGGLSGLLGGKNISLKSYYVDVTKEADLSINLQAKYLPIVYGTQQVGGIPIFADTDQNDPYSVWVVYQLCEGEIEGILDIYIDDKPIICLDDQDDAGRVCFGRKRVVS